MLMNSSSFDDLSLFSSSISYNSSFDLQTNPCFRSEMTILIFSAFSFINLLLLPLFIFVFYLGYQQWRQQRTLSTAATSHSNLFIYHSITMQLILFLGFTCFFCGGYIDLPEMLLVGHCIWSIAAFGQTLFHILTCVEHYLAVIHPITYLNLKQAGEVRIRNISIGCVWLLSFGWLAGYYLTNYTSFIILYCCSMALILIIILFCSISVLCALKRPGPGEVGGNREWVDQSKQRAFYTIMTIMVVLLFRFVGNVTGNMIYNSELVSPSDSCVAYMSIGWADLPSSLVLPLLFLQRTGKLQCFKQNTESQ